MKSILLLVAVVVGSLVFTGCNQKKEVPENFDYGKVADGKYRNSYFDLEISVPEGWAVQSEAEMEATMKQGEKLVAGENKELKNVLKASEVNVANLLAVYQYKKGTNTEFNPSLLMTAENIKSFPNIKTGNDYLTSTRAFLVKSEFKYDQIDSVFAKENVNGSEFYRMHTAVDYSGIHIQQDYYSAVVNGFCLSVIISYSSDEQKASMDKFLGTLKFN